MLFLKVGNLNVYSPSQSYIISGNFENIGGLKVRAPVKSAGVVVGRVTNINRNSDKVKARN
jgi:phospholipid/cholesterol/gamma-HCH transport system substrate-binding protein